MREKYVKKGNAIYYYTIEWDAAKLSWANFRGIFLGATDPSEAKKVSLRRNLLDKWEDFKLESQPNVGDNGFHGSASPLEGLAERLNWVVGSKLEDDAFGKALLDSGIDKETILSWTRDPQVDYEGKTGSLFDIFEDQDAAESLRIAQAIAKVDKPVASFTKNMALVFIKPSALNDGVKNLFVKKAKKCGLTITSEGEIKAKTIDEKKLIDNHYNSIAMRATVLKAKDFNISAKNKTAFKKQFSISWNYAVKKELVFNAMDACKELGLDAASINQMWATAKKEKLMLKFGGGFYCGRLYMASSKSERKVGEAEMYGPKMCQGCLKVIEEGIAIKIPGFGLPFHLECWKCSKCDVKFDSLPKDQRTFVIREEKPVCKTCVDKEKTEIYENLDWMIRARGQICLKCGASFQDEFVVNLIVGLYHTTCLECVNPNCFTPLDFTGPTQKFLETSKGVWHNECVICTTCGETIDLSKDHREESTGIYHSGCPSKKIGVPCGACDDGITGNFVELKGVKFHSKCFKCMNCDMDLNGQKVLMKRKKIFCSKKCYRSFSIK